ncbi:MAG: hypothetical protein V2G41_09760 [bacterium JZ-2024 1]
MMKTASCIDGSKIVCADMVELTLPEDFKPRFFSITDKKVWAQYEAAKFIWKLDSDTENEMGLLGKRLHRLDLEDLFRFYYLDESLRPSPKELDKAKAEDAPVFKALAVACSGSLDITMISPEAGASQVYHLIASAVCHIAYNICATNCPLAMTFLLIPEDDEPMVRLLSKPAIDLRGVARIFPELQIQELLGKLDNSIGRSAGLL